ncbi:hypothetical protein BMETH_436_1 [methanotrophic bacterial endosymbiont of Bathymodiolus sp.]|nr:hypothetical protein BMETH_436_1 [methanotrophic bacterial endosymbiont of Bathymodiolus sp.]
MAVSVFPDYSTPQCIKGVPECPSAGDVPFPTQSSVLPKQAPPTALPAPPQASAVAATAPLTYLLYMGVLAETDEMLAADNAAPPKTVAIPLANFIFFIFFLKIVGNQFVKKSTINIRAKVHFNRD